MIVTVEALGLDPTNSTFGIGLVKLGRLCDIASENA